MTTDNDDQRPENPGHDRRAFLQRAGIGAVAVGAWVAPQVLFTGVASAGCTPVTRLLQITSFNCTSNTGVTTTNSLGSSCQPAGWASGRNDGVTFTCASIGSGGHAVTITGGCAPTAGRAVKLCPFGSGSGLSCVSGTIVGNTITFPALSSTEISNGCAYITYRITVTCCT